MVCGVCDLRSSRVVTNLLEDLCKVDGRLEREREGERGGERRREREAEGVKCTLLYVSHVHVQRYH